MLRNGGDATAADVSGWTVLSLAVLGIDMKTMGLLNGADEDERTVQNRKVYEALKKHIQAECRDVDYGIRRKRLRRDDKYFVISRATMNNELFPLQCNMA